MKLGVISLGCDKATVDSERLVGELVGHGAVVSPDLLHADVILVNTCGFIDAAKQESIDALLSAARLKAQGDVKAVDRKSTRLNSSHGYISYAVFCLKKKKSSYPTPTHSAIP